MTVYLALASAFVGVLVAIPAVREGLLSAVLPPPWRPIPALARRGRRRAS